MYRPTLKRSTPSSTREIKVTHKNTANNNYSVQVLQPIKTKALGCCIVPPQILQIKPELNKKSNSQLFNPLVCNFQQYPKQVAELLIEDNQKNRNIGVFKNIYWLHYENSLYLWRQNQDACRPFEFPGVADTIALGQIKCFQRGTNKQRFILAFSILNQLYLYSVDESLKPKDLNTKYRLQGCQIIQAIRFVSKNELIFGSSSGHYCYIDFEEEERQYKTRQSLLKKILPPKYFILNQPQTFIEQLIYDKKQKKIFVLRRIQKKPSWLVLKLWSLIYDVNDQSPLASFSVEEVKQIEVYGIKKATCSIQLLYKYNEKDLIFKIINGMKKKIRWQEAQIMSIYLQVKQNQSNLGVVCKNGIFACFQNSNKPFLYQEPKQMVSPSQVGKVGFLIQKQQDKPDTSAKTNTVLKSLGFNNLTLTNNFAIFCSNSRIDLVKCQNIIGDLVERNNQIDVRVWTLFTKQGCYNITQLNYQQLILLYVYYKSELKEKQLDKTWLNDTSFQSFIERGAKLLGNIGLSEVLVKILFKQDLGFLRVNKLFYQMIKSELEGKQAKQYRDWQHQISPAIESVVLNFNKKGLIDQIWNILIEFQNRQPTFNNQLSSPQLKRNSYWYSLQLILRQIIQSLRKLKPFQLKKYIKEIEIADIKLSQLEHFFQNKKLMEINYRQLSHSNRYNPQYLFENKTFDSLNSFDFGSKMVDRSLKIEQVLHSCTAKLKCLLKIYIMLVQVNSNEDIPTFQETLTSKKAQLKIKKYVIQFIPHFDELQAIHGILPELDLQRWIKFNAWYNLQLSQKEKEGYKIDFKQGAQYLTSENIKSVKDLFLNEFDKQVQLLSLCYLNLAAEIQSKRQKIKYHQSRQIDEQTAESQNQNINYMEEQQVFMEEAIKKSIEDSIISRQHAKNKPRADLIIDQVIQVVAFYNIFPIINYLQNLLREKILDSKINFLILCQKRRQHQLELVQKKIVLNQSNLTSQLLRRRQFFGIPIE